MAVNERTSVVLISKSNGKGELHERRAGPIHLTVSEILRDHADFTGCAVGSHYELRGRRGEIKVVDVDQFDEDADELLMKKLEEMAGRGDLVIIVS